MRRNEKLSINGNAMNERGTEAKNENNSVSSIFLLIPTKYVFKLFSAKNPSQKY